MIVDDSFNCHSLSLTIMSAFKRFMLVDDSCRNRPFAAYSHMVQKPPCWEARDALGQDKQRTYII